MKNDEAFESSSEQDRRTLSDNSKSDDICHTRASLGSSNTTSSITQVFSSCQRGIKVQGGA